MMQQATTVLTVKDVAASLAWYRDRLGFGVAFTWGEPAGYAGLFRDEIRLHLIAATRTTRPPGNGAVTVDVDDADALHAELVKRGANIAKPPADQPYGMREFDVTDPDGNTIFFAHELKRTAA